ncbi:hypothetical protein PUN28_018385 [Cardiocondyla obscurior]|uniref:Uncharacterized protein n=1 Tax=Cardiocondyla obscurior TaxID=286306 RepID=A0AAW2EH48_9HYME
MSFICVIIRDVFSHLNVNIRRGSMNILVQLIHSFNNRIFCPAKAMHHCMKRALTSVNRTHHAIVARFRNLRIGFKGWTANAKALTQNGMFVFVVTSLGLSGKPQGSANMRCFTLSGWCMV